MFVLTPGIRMRHLCSGLVAASALVFSSGPTYGGGTEHLVFSLPSGWQPVTVETSETHQKTVVFPIEAGSTDRQEMIVISMTRGPDAPDVRTAQLRAANDYAAVCEAWAASSLQFTVEGTGGRGFWTINCPRRRDTGRGEVSFFLYLRGSVGSYLVQKSWETPAFEPGSPPLSEDRMADALEFLGAIRLEE